MKKHAQSGSIRQVVPAVFLLLLMLCALVSPWMAWPLVTLLLAYALYCLGASAAAAQQGGSWSLMPALPLVIATYHLSYALGCWAGLIDVLQGITDRDRFTGLTR